MKLRIPPLAAAAAAVLLSTTGYCAFNQQPVSPVNFNPALSPPVRLLPEAVVPYPLDDVE